MYTTRRRYEYKYFKKCKHLVANLIFFLGYCCIIYMQCTDANSFTINPGTGGNDMWTMGKIQSNCAEDYIGIEGCIDFFKFKNVYE